MQVQLGLRSLLFAAICATRTCIDAAVFGIIYNHWRSTVYTWGCYWVRFAIATSHRSAYCF